MGKKFSKVTTSHWGAFNVFVENDKIIKTEPFAMPPLASVCSETVKVSLSSTTLSTIVLSENEPLLFNIENGCAVVDVGGATVKSESEVVPCVT